MEATLTKAPKRDDGERGREKGKKGEREEREKGSKRMRDREGE